VLRTGGGAAAVFETGSRSAGRGPAPAGRFCRGRAGSPSKKCFRARM